MGSATRQLVSKNATQLQRRCIEKTCHSVLRHTHLHQGLHPHKLSERAPTRAQGTVRNPRPKVPPRHYQGKVAVRPQAVGAHGCSLP
jgi:hypothetical protein